MCLPDGPCTPIHLWPRQRLRMRRRSSPLQGESVFERDQAVAQRTTVMPPLPEDRFLCSFSHIFAGGYSAG